MNHEKELLKQAYDALKLHFEPQGTKVLQKPWKPKIGEFYGYVDSHGIWFEYTWNDTDYDNHRHAIGNCYPPTEEGKELAIWEQVTRQKYEKALKDAADWVSGGWYYAFWDYEDKKIRSTLKMQCHLGLPRFATDKSAIDAHTRILGNDTERYLNRK